MENRTETLQTRNKISKPQINIPMISKSEVKIMFVCKKNTGCSPMAEFIMKYLVNSEGLSDKVTITSAGCFTDPEETMVSGVVKELHKHQIPFIKKNAVQFDESNIDKYDYIICMAQEQIRTLLRGRRSNKFLLLMNFAGEHRSIYDPSYNSKYSEIYSTIYKGCTALLGHLQKIFAKNTNATGTVKKTILTIPVNEDLLLSFESALILKHESIDSALEKFMKRYTAEASKIFTGRNSGRNSTRTVKYPRIIRNRPAVGNQKSLEEKSNLSDEEIIEQFVRKMASGASQINQRIIKAYFKSIELTGKATFDSMKELCTNQKKYPGLYIYKNNGFDNHYKQMKTNSSIDGKIKDGKSIDGKVFWESNQEVKVLSAVEPFLEKYKPYFN